MKNLWDQKTASRLEKTPIQLRVFSSQLIGLDSDLVLHGGGNTSVKLHETNIFGEEEDILYVKGSGRNLATIDKEGFTHKVVEEKQETVEQVWDAIKKLKVRGAPAIGVAGAYGLLLAIQDKTCLLYTSPSPRD